MITNNKIQYCNDVDVLGFLIVAEVRSAAVMSVYNDVYHELAYPIMMSLRSSDGVGDVVRKELET